MAPERARGGKDEMILALQRSRIHKKFEWRPLTACIPVLVPPAANVLSVYLELDLDDASRRTQGSHKRAKAARVSVNLLTEPCWQTRLGEEQCHGGLQPVR